MTTTPVVLQYTGTAGHGTLTTSLLLLAVLLTSARALAPDWQWVTVLAVSKPNGAANAYSLLMSPGSFNDATKKELLPPDTIVASGNFKSSLVDQWSVYRPKKARIAVYDSEGYPIWFADFNHTAGGKDPSLWLTASSFTGSSDRKLNTAKDASFLMDNTKLKVTIANKMNSRLELTWDSNPVLFLLSARSWPLGQPSLSPSSVAATNKDMVLAQASITASSSFALTSSHTFWMFLFSTTYMAGMGLRKNASAPGELTQFMLSVAIDPQCSPRTAAGDYLYRPIYEPGTTNAKVFTATYDHGADKSLALFWFDNTVAAKCLKLVVVSSSGSHHTTIFLYNTEHEVLEGETFAIQWWIDTASTTTPAASTCKLVTVCENAEAVTSLPASFVVNDTERDRIQKETELILVVPKEETTRYKRQFISIPDHRPSAMVIGILGVSFISVVVLFVVALDFSNIAVQLKVMKSNLKHAWSTAKRPKPQPTDPSHRWASSQTQPAPNSTEA